MIKKILKKQKGFTLVELLAVIVILGIIAAIAVPAIGNVISNTRDDAALNDAQQAIDAAKLYVTAENFEVTTTAKDITIDMLKPYLDKASGFTKVTVVKNGSDIEYTLVGHSKAEAVVTNKGTNDATTGLVEKEIQDALATN